MKNIVVAYDKNMGIGADNDLLWMRDLPADLKHFKDLTMGHAILMGRKTYESIGRPLPGRRSIVLSRTATDIPGVTCVQTLSDAFSEAGDEIDIIGGGQIYELAFPYVDVIYATEVQAAFPQASVFFPKIDTTEWREESRDHHEADDKNKYAFDFVVYRRTAPLHIS